MFNVAWPKFSLTFIDVRSYVHNPLIGPIYDTIYWIANMLILRDFYSFCSILKGFRG